MALKYYMNSAYLSRACHFTFASVDANSEKLSRIKQEEGRSHFGIMWRSFGTSQGILREMIRCRIMVNLEEGNRILQKESFPKRVYKIEVTPNDVYLIDKVTDQYAKRFIRIIK